MLRICTLLALSTAVISAFALYSVNYHTSQRARIADSLEKRRDQLVREIAILRAERAYLARPDRIKPLALKLGMRPIAGRQMISRKAVLNGKTNW